jgi:diguanylate cyclase (GGDEF)-like protein
MPLTIMMIDINGLKAINETVGFPEGDKIILTASRIIESCCRSNDVIARTGGSSFVILMSNKPSNDAAETYNKIKSICNKYNNNLPSNVYQLHLSIGFSTQQSTEHSINEVRKAAEDAMYKNKLLDHSSSHNSVITSITSTMFERSRETELHAFRIKRLSRHMGELLEFTPDKIDELLLLSTLHDIGKVAISDQILNKPGPLTAEEWVEMKKHPMAGYRIAMASPLLKPISNYILSHHERWDGLGYPRGLKGVEIPLLSRVLSVIDAFDAMTEDRAYRKKMPVEIALKEIKDNSGTQFDPKVANIFVTMINESNDEEYK